MKINILILSLILFSLITYGQSFKFETTSPFIIKEDKNNSKTISISFTIKNPNPAVANYNVTYAIIDKESSATLNKDFTIMPPIVLVVNAAGKYSSKIDIDINSDDFVENNEAIVLEFSITNAVVPATKLSSSNYTVLIQDVNDGNSDAPIYSEKEKRNTRGISFDLYTGGTFDFYDALKIGHIGGEVLVKANDIVGRSDKFGFYTGIFNFQNFSYDSSNVHTRSENIRIDTGAYINGVTSYVKRAFVDHKKISTNQWGYYFNPTYRIGDKSDFFNMYVSLHLEVLRTAATTTFNTDTISISDTVNYPLGNSPVFQSGKGFLKNNYTDIFSNGYFGIGFPFWLNAQDKVRFYFDPVGGVATHTASIFDYAGNRTIINRESVSEMKPFYLFRFRASEQFSGLNITIGGEIRGLLPTYTPTINVYLGIRADLVKLFKKS